MNTYREAIEAALRAAVIHTRTTYSWFGERSPRLPPAVRRALTPEATRSYLSYALQSHLYAHFYCKGTAQPADAEETGYTGGARTPFVETLAAANAGSGHWESGWQVRMVVAGEVLAHKNGLSLRTRRADCEALDGGALAPGAGVRLRFPKEYLGMSPGFYLAHGNTVFSSEAAHEMVRLYWHITPEGAACLLRGVTARLNQARLPFKLKVLNDPARYTRCDAAVLYVGKPDYAAVATVLEAIYPDVAPYLRAGTPVFTKPLEAGLGLAEDPGGGESFGLDRCRLVAEGMIRAFEQGRHTLDERLQSVEGCFAEEGLSLDMPFLRAASSDVYVFRPRRAPQAHATAAPRQAIPRRETHTDAFLQTAHEIGRRLSQEAVWHQDRCTWFGAAPERNGGSSRLVYKTVDPCLYTGPSGIALFLAELHATTGDAPARRTALGAIRQALARLDAVSPVVRQGLYTGWPGIALATARMGVLLQEDALLNRAARLMRRALRETPETPEWDLLSGTAGALVAALTIHPLLDDRSLLDGAVRLGEALIDRAETNLPGYSWPSPSFAHQHNLTGFSHGTAGIGYALLELFQATADVRYRDAAEQAFRYERHWFDDEAANWPDFREASGRTARTERSASFMTSWCHGAPGIALSRLRAYEITDDATCRAEAVTALQTTHAAMTATRGTTSGNYSLCHGLAGNADVLYDGAQVLGTSRNHDAALARQVAEAGIGRYASQGHWPCGTGGGQAPGLMLGLAGIGYFYLRLYDPAIPSLLLLRPEAFAGKQRMRHNEDAFRCVNA